MSSTEALPQHEQPMVTVKDYRPSCHSFSSSSADSDTTDGNFHFEPEKPFPFVHLPKNSRYGKPYNTRYTNGLWTEKPIITTVQTPIRLRCWAISGPHEFYDEQPQREPFSIDDDTVVPMTGLVLLTPPRQQNCPLLTQAARARGQNIASSEVLHQGCASPPCQTTPQLFAL